MRMVCRKAAEVPEIGQDGICLTNPGSDAVFPCVVLSPPLQRPKYHGAAWDLSFTVEVWARKQYEVMRLFDEVKKKLWEYNLMLTNNTPLTCDDNTEKWRFGGYFECRFNAITNSFEKNR